MTTGLRVVVHDYAGYAFPIQLSRWLATQGCQVLHLYCDDVEAPRGPIDRRADDPASLIIEAVPLGGQLAKYQLIRRWRQETAYGRRLTRRIKAFHPDVVLTANTPPAPLAKLTLAGRNSPPVVCWVQDLFGAGAAAAVRRWPPPLRWAAQRFVQGTETRALNASAGLVLITDDFAPLLSAQGVTNQHVTTIENWAPADEITPRSKDNPWAGEHGLQDAFVFLYAGTLGLKHNPDRLADLAHAWGHDPAVRVVAVCQGPGRVRLEALKAARSLDNLLLFDYQSYEQVSDVLASGDVLVMLLEEFAGAISAPSKTYAYFCAERPILAAAPAHNLARRLIEREQAGLCVDAGDGAAFLAAAARLRSDPPLLDRLASGQRRYASSAFDISRIGQRFLTLLEQAVTRHRAAATGTPLWAEQRRKLGKAALLLRTPRYRRGLLAGVAAGIEHDLPLRSLIPQTPSLQTVVDVGANKGQFALLALELFPQARIHSFEPLPGALQRLTAWSQGERRLTVHPLALADARGLRLFHVTARPDSSSLRAVTVRQTDLFPGTHAVGNQDVEVDRLDSVLSANNLPSPALLKLDVQGGELDVLIGASGLLASFDWIYAECSFIELYEGQALMDDVVRYLSKVSFVPVFCGLPCRDAAGRPMQTDVLFTRLSSPEPASIPEMIPVPADIRASRAPVPVG